MRQVSAAVGVTGRHTDDGRRIADRHPLQLAATDIAMVFVVDNDPQVRASLQR